MASSNGPQGAKLPHRSSDLTISEHDNERAPLLSNTTSADTGGHGQGDSDPTTLYVQALETHLPWYKRPSVFWLLPILTLYWITGGMVFSSKSQFHAALLCREYLNRYTTNTTAFLTNQGVDAFMLTGDTFSVAMRPSAECQVPEIQAFTAKIMGLLEVFNGLAGILEICFLHDYLFPQRRRVSPPSDMDLTCPSSPRHLFAQLRSRLVITRRSVIGMDERVF
jgi:hypothetical protein